jgi:hypothetical protein
MSSREALFEAVAREKALIARLEGEQEQARARLRTLEQDVAFAAPSSAAPTPATAAEKVGLFRGLFRGREDVFPKHWANARTGRKGYAPVCANEWVRGVCEKPRIKCGECPNQAFVSLSDEVVLDHLRGRHVMGVYPLLENDHCWFLAADFDKQSWVDDVAAFVETCEAIDIPVSVERSRSGNGAHVWFFFAAPVPAATARRMGCYLITETMSRRHQLAFESYDRLFPNQDTLPRGGFGNLIALPLQYEARQKGNTVFVDHGLVPYADQWAYLARLQRLNPATVDEIAGEASRRGQVIGLTLAASGEEGDEAPWTVPPSRKPRRIPLAEAVPEEVRVVLGQRLFVEKARLPCSSIANRCSINGSRSWRYSLASIPRPSDRSVPGSGGRLDGSTSP